MTEITPYLCVADSRAALEWYAAALGATVTVPPYVMEDGRVGHCELSVGDGARVMMSDEFESAGVAPPDPARGNAVTLHVRVDDCDAWVARVVAQGHPRPRARDHRRRPGRGLP